MSFRYEVVTPYVLNEICKLFGKPTTEWTDEEAYQAELHMEVLRIAASQRKK